MKKLTAGRGVSLRACLMFGAAGIALGTPGVALAQGEDSVEAPPPYEEEDAFGNQIIVTAVKREQTLQQTPVAVSVTLAETLERAQIRDISDLQTVVPSLRVHTNQSSSQSTFAIRGFGNGANNAGIEPSVGVFVDGVYRSRITGRISDFPDIQRVEVLRGPQSTLFGKNASVGVISIRTQPPQFRPGGSLEATYGNFNSFVLKGHVTGPVSDNVAMSLAAGGNWRDGYIDDLGTGTDINDRNRWFVRGQMLFEPSTDLSIRLIADYDMLDENCCGVMLLQPSPASGVIQLLGGMQSDPDDPFADVTFNNFVAENEIENYGISGEINYAIGALDLTSITSFRRSDALTRQDVDFSSADLIYPFLTDIKVDTFTQELRLAAEFGDVVTALLGAFYISESVDQTGALRYGADMRDYVDIQVMAATGGALDVAALEQTFGFFDGDPTQYLGDFFRAGTGIEEAYTLDSEALSIFGQFDVELAPGLTLTLGGNYTFDSKTFVLDSVATDVFSSIDLDAPQYAPFRYQLLYEGGLSQQVGAALMLGRGATAGEIFAFATDPMTAPIYALIEAGVDAFAMANMNNPAANPLAVARPLQFIPPFLKVPNAVEDGKIDDEDFSYTVRLSYDVSPNFNLYATYATGFKAASVNLSRDSRPFPADQAALAGAGLITNNLEFGTRYAEPEEATVYEFGAKGTWDMLSANLAVFQQEIEGFQSNIFTGSGFALANAGKQSTFGVELESQVYLTDEFTLNLGVTYLDPYYDDFEFSSVGDLTGTIPAGIPEWTIMIGGDYDHELGNGDNLILRANYLHESEVQIVEGLPGYLTQGQGAAIAAAVPFTRTVDDLSASITYAMESGLEFSIWGRNLLDDRYFVNIFDTPAQPLSISGYPNQPLTYGGTVRFKW
ncbi:MAG TPA: TonB-dependent receptor [Sphingomonadaceae bacterium]|nr:TonB-dependent receptor [Sphingomonadaceae bacterium]